MLLTLPDDIISSEQFSEAELLMELAIALYVAGKISFGQARRRAGMDWFRFRQLLSERNIASNYDKEELYKDLETIKSLPFQ